MSLNHSLKSSILLLVIGFSISFISCGGGENESTKAASEPTSNNTGYKSESKELSCESLGTFYSYEGAVRKVRNADYEFTDAVSTPGSSWVSKAEYYSCDGSRGYFIIYLTNGDYIHENMPVSIWRSFKNAASHGSFYSSRIKGNYILYLD